jgi:hypothetical protein
MRLERDFETGLMSPDDQQPIQRTIGRRQTRNGQPLSTADRAAMTRNANYRTRAPKGVFFYASHEQMQADRERWRIDLMLQRNSAR